MSEKYYSPGTLKRFYKNILCEKDPITYRHFENDRAEFFQKRLTNSDSTEQVVYVECTNILRDLLYEIIEDLTVHMKDWGDLIITGGEAFNNYFDMPDRIVSSDIDTKFVPRFLSPFDKKFFGFLQVCKLVMWNRLGKISEKFNKKFQERIKLLSKTKIGKLLSISPCNHDICLKRRYTLIRKSPSRSVLIDVELFALDLTVKYYSPTDKRVMEKTLGGILDIPFMRPYELGYEVAFNRERGVHVFNPSTQELVYFRNVLLASKLFLLEDLFIMKTLGLRPKKVKKDRDRLLTFSKKVLKIKNITSKNSDEDIFKRSVKVIPAYPIIKLVGSSLPKISNVPSPTQYTKYTTEPTIHQVKKHIVPGIITKKFREIDGFEKTDSNMYFDRKSKTWKKTKNPVYVKDIYNFRLTSEKYKVKPQKLIDTLYSMNTRRNNWVKPDVLKKSAMIPLVGLKNSDFKEIVK